MVSEIFIYLFFKRLKLEKSIFTIELKVGNGKYTYQIKSASPEKIIWSVVKILKTFIILFIGNKVEGS